MGTRVENIRTNVYLNTQDVGKNLRQLTSEGRKLRNEFALLTPGTEKYIAASKRLKEVEGSIRNIKNEVKSVDSSWGKAANGFNKYFTMITAGLAAVAGFALGIQSLITQNAELSDSMADVQKTTGLTLQEVKELYAEFGKMNTRTSRSELLKLAEEAGRLGKDSKKDVLDFVKAANQLKVALGDDLGADDAIRTVGKLTEQYKVGEKEGVGFEKAMLKIGSAINEISAAGSAQAGFLVDYMSRMVGASKQANILAQDQLGFAAVLDESGQQVETSATAMSKLIVDMFTNTSDYAAVAQMDVESFSKLLNTDANEALLKVLEGLNGNNEGFSTMAKKLQDLGVDGSRAIDVLSTLSSQTQKIRDKQKLANEALQEGVSLTNEYNIKNENLAAGWERLQRSAAKLFVNSTITDGLKDMVFWANKLIEVPISENMEENRIALLGLRTELLEANTSSERRLAIITQLKTEYPEYLGNINAETVSNKDLIPVLDEINSHLIKRVALQIALEKVQENESGLGKNMGEQAKYMLELRQLIARMKEERNITIDETADAVTQGKIIFDKLSNMDKLTGDGGELGNLIYNKIQGNQKVVDAYKKGLIDARLEMENMSKELDAMLGKSTNIDKDFIAPSGETPEEAAARMAAENATAASIANARQEEREKEKKAIEDAQNKIDEFLKKAAEARELDGLTKQQAEIKQVEQKYADLFALAEKYHLNKLELEAAQKAEIDAVNAQYEAERLAGLEAQALASDTEAEANKNFALKLKADENELMLEYYRSDFENYDAFQKAKQQSIEETARVEIAKRQAMHQAATRMAEDLMFAAQQFPALAVAAKGAASAVALFETYKGAQLAYNSLVAIPFVGPVLGTAAAAAAVIAGLARVKQINSTQIKGSYAEGGYTGFGFGTPDHTGYKPAGVVHEGEYVIPKWMLQNSQVANTTAMLEDIRTQKQGFAGGGLVQNATTTNNTTVLNQTEVVTLLKQLVAQNNRPALAVFGDKAVRDIDERMKKDAEINNKSKLN